MSERTQTLARLWSILSWAVLLFLWLTVLQVFWIKMEPRFAYILAHRAIAVDPPCITPECDFSVFWPAGFMARTGDLLQVYQTQMFESWGQGIFPPGLMRETFYYPPTMLLPAALISYVPFEAGFFVWTAALLALSATLLRRAGYSWIVVAATLLSPAALWNTELGQLGAVGGALLLAGLALAARAPLAGGALLGILSLKPQIGLLVPALFLGQRNWRAAITFASVCVAIATLSLVVFGPGIWSEYLTLGRQAAGAVINAAFIPRMSEGGGVSVFWSLRSLGADLTAAYAGQGMVSLAAMAAGVWVWRQDLALPRQIALTVFLSLLAMPYGYGDDMVAWSAVLAARAQARGGRIGLLDALFWIWPEAVQIITMSTGVLFTPLVVALALGRELLEARRGA